MARLDTDSFLRKGGKKKNNKLKNQVPCASQRVRRSPQLCCYRSLMWFLLGPQRMAYAKQAVQPLSWPATPQQVLPGERRSELQLPQRLLPAMQHMGPVRRLARQRFLRPRREARDALTDAPCRSITALEIVSTILVATGLSNGGSHMEFDRLRLQHSDFESYHWHSSSVESRWRSDIN
jgi:hypothetical protein